MTSTLATKKMTSSSSPPSNHDNVYYKVIDINGRGKSLIATQSLHPGIEGLTIMEDIPLMISPIRGSNDDQSGPLPTGKISNFLNPQFWTDYWSYQQQPSHIQHKICQLYYNRDEAILYEKAIKAVLPKKYQQPQQQTTEKFNIVEFVNVIMVFRYNAAHVQGLGRGVFEYACRMNHSCLPNCCWMDSEDGSGKRIVRLVTPISKNEEFTIDYVESRLLPTTERQRKLKVSKNFHCTCTRCTLSIDTTRRYSCQNCTIGVHFITKVMSNNQSDTRTTTKDNTNEIQYEYTLSPCNECNEVSKQSLQTLEEQEQLLQNEINLLRTKVDTNISLSTNEMERILYLQPPHRLHCIMGDSFFITQANQLQYIGKRNECIQIHKNRLECYETILGIGYPNSLIGMACELLADAILFNDQSTSPPPPTATTTMEEKEDNNKEADIGSHLSIEEIQEVEQLYQKAIRIFQITTSGCHSTLSQHAMEKLYTVQNQKYSILMNTTKTKGNKNNNTNIEQQNSKSKDSCLCALCGATATKKCSRCSQVGYCSRDHQRAHWSVVHKAQCHSKTT